MLNFAPDHPGIAFRADLGNLGAIAEATGETISHGINHNTAPARSAHLPSALLIYAAAATIRRVHASTAASPSVSHNRATVGPAERTLATQRTPSGRRLAVPTYHSTAPARSAHLPAALLIYTAQDGRPRYAVSTHRLPRLLRCRTTARRSALQNGLLPLNGLRVVAV